MTPFGARVRELRKARGLSLQALAGTLGISSAYLSALEHGKRGRPTFVLVQGIIHSLGIIWDEADELVRLADMSDPRVTVDTAWLQPAATMLANRIARQIGDLSTDDIAAMTLILDQATARTHP